MSMFSVGGLASGLDTKSIISQLMEIEGRSKTKAEWSRELWTQRKSAWSDVNNRLLTLQTRANALNAPSTWSGTPGINSSDATKVTGTAVGPSPAAGTYALEVTQLAATERWAAANATTPATGGSRVSGTWYDGAYASASGSTALTSLTDFDGTSLGVVAGTTITLSASVNGSPVSNTFTVASGSTLDDLAQWAESNFPGASFSVNGDGTISYQSAPGTSNEINSLSFSASNGGTPLALFNATDGAQSSYVAPPTNGSAADTLTITQGASTWNVAIAEGADESAIAAAINGTAGIGVSASVVGGRLQIDAAASGASGSFTVTSAGALATNLGLAETVAGQDAQFSVDGTNYTRSTNTGISDIITDVGIDLVAPTTAPVTLTVTAGTGNTADIKKKLTEFVDAYNAVIDHINAKTGETKVVNAKSLNDYLKGPVARDFGMSSVALEIRQWATSDIAGLAQDKNTLDDIGITTGAVSTGYSPQNVSGRLVIDEAKLDAALAADPAKVKEIITRVGGAAGKEDDGIARRISALVSELRVGGKVDFALQGASRQVRDLQSRIDRHDDRLERKRAYYERMFASLETTLGRMQSQGSWMSGQLASLSGGR